MLAYIRRSSEGCLEIDGDGASVPGSVRGSIGFVIGLLGPWANAMMALDLARGLVWRWISICGNNRFVYIPCC